MAVYGIDLGTTYSCIAYVDDVGRPTVLRNLEGTDTTPSVVFFESPDNVVVGATAKDSAVLEPDLVVSRIKRDMGQDVPRVRHGRPYTPEEISAFVLRKLADDARTATGDTVEDVVITVPAYFGAAERDATRKAGQIAGLNVIDIVSEPIAAAITYGVLNPGADHTILVYDLGGGTFDTTVITLKDGDIEVVCTDGDHELGGADWDDRLVEHLAESFQAEHPDAGDPLLDKQSEQQLRRDAEDLKKTLSTRTQHVVRVVHDGRVATVEVTRETLLDLTRDLLDRTVEITRRTIDTAAAKGVRHYDHLVLVGGSTKMPAVAETLQKEFQLLPRLQDPDLAVAKGAALYAFEETYRRLIAEGRHDQAEDMAARAGLTADQQEQIAGRTIKTVASRAFGIVVVDKETRRRGVAHLVHANDALPAAVTQDFYTIDDGQTGVDVEVMEQAGAVESESPEDNGLIAEGLLQIPSGKPAGWPVEVTFALDASGLLQVTARERETGEALELRIQIGGMSEEDVAESRAALSRVQVG
ncbi:molecular chaperone DnaK [Sphaerisporangium krabiense]|uniref:Molecular chaperone DnaK (HSP70) n=1 Tax=Sphaerisporangium krabiense TaxID=763782 RepID=A0A7W8Z7W9_9ACTN|nr:Hsp70 family protein [Sphaerisporangium krabiense]MBB5629088.1 molecular chaperone DnaK (HSP70) [Sphaerisporangium krabiense]GII60072.1 molecular chaperone DnaK [Sphaerisporangium krabiense]